MKMLTSCFTTLLLCLLLAGCGGDKPLFTFDDSNSGGNGGTQANAPAGVYVGTTSNSRQYLAVLVPDGTGSMQFIWWYTAPSNSLGTGNLDGFLSGGLTPTSAGTDNGTFTIGSLTDFDLSSAGTASASLSGNSYASGAIMGSLTQDGTTVSYNFTLQALPALTLTDLATSSPYAGSTLNLAGSSLTNLNMQIQGDGSFIASDTGSTCSFAGTLSSTLVNSVFLVSLPANAPTSSGNCMGVVSLARNGIAVKYNGSFYMAAANVGGTTAGSFGPPAN